MKYLLLFFLCSVIAMPVSLSAQKITYSDFEKDDGRDMNFEIIGKMNGNFLVYKNFRWKHKISIFDNDMNTREIAKLDFLPEKTLNVDFITYPDYFYIIYQYQKRNMIHCMGVKMDGNGRKISEPVELDTTQLTIFSENKIYSTIYSEDKQKIMVFKMQKKYDRMHIVTLLYDNHLQLLKKSRMALTFNERRDNFGDMLLDNEGNLVTSFTTTPPNREYSNELNLVTKAPLQDSLVFHPVNLDKFLINDVKLKIDNLNSHYILNAFFYKKNNGSVEGLFSYTWDRATDKSVVSGQTVFSDSLRAEARRDGRFSIAFDDFVIRQVIVRKDGGFLLVTEDFSSQTNNNNNLNRWNSLYSPYSLYPNSYYSYNPYYNSYYRPFTGFNYQNTRYYYSNIVVFSINNKGIVDWKKVIHKDQVDDNDDNFLSYFTLNEGGEIHFLFNMDRKNQIIADQSLLPDGTDKRNATLKSEERGYQFMTKLSKQVSAKELLIPSLYRGNICFAKVEL